MRLLVFCFEINLFGLQVLHSHFWFSQHLGLKLIVQLSLQQKSVNQFWHNVEITSKNGERELELFEWSITAKGHADLFWNQVLHRRANSSFIVYLENLAWIALSPFFVKWAYVIHALSEFVFLLAVLRSRGSQSVYLPSPPGVWGSGSAADVHAIWKCRLCQGFHWQADQSKQVFWYVGV